MLINEGEVLFDYVQCILCLMEEVKVEVNLNKFRKFLIIGVLQIVFVIKVFFLFLFFLKEYWDIEVKIKIDRKYVLQEMFLYGEIDGFFFSGIYNEVQFERVYCYVEKMVFILFLYEVREEKD